MHIKSYLYACCEVIFPEKNESGISKSDEIGTHLNKVLQFLFYKSRLNCMVHMLPFLFCSLKINLLFQLYYLLLQLK